MNVRREDDRARWLIERNRGLGASDASAALGIDPWRSRYQLWSEKSGLLSAEDLSKNNAVQWGIRLETPIAEAFAEMTGRKVIMWPQYEIAIHPDHPWMMCTPDATQVHPERGPGLLQIKTTSAWLEKEWDVEPPLHYQVQLAHELAVTGYSWGTLAVLIGGQRLHFVDCDRNEAFIAALIPALREFWRLVETKTEPPLDDKSPSSIAKVLSRLHPDDSGETIDLPVEAMDWTQRLAQVKDQLKQLEDERTILENRIKHAIGDATYGALVDGSRWSWKSQTRASYVVEETTFRVLRKLK